MLFRSVMAAGKRKPLVLDFEKPLVDLEDRINRIRQMADENGVDVTEQIQQLEARATQLRQEVYTSLSAVQDRKSTRLNSSH